jgi:phenylacetate-coenzyme A ligase PaaK-like adenylate-forming protein
MTEPEKWKESFTRINEQDFESTALNIFRYQALNNQVYAEYLQHLKVLPEKIESILQIPFLPISFFKTHKVVTGHLPAQVIFESSGTTGQIPSKHYVADTEIYEASFLAAFRRAFGNPEEMCIMALLPSYLERGSSSLVYMADRLIKLSNHAHSGFFLDDLPELSNKLRQLSANVQPTLLLGVSFALLELAEKYPQPLGNNIKIMETGGMKGRRKELTRDELHHELTTAFNVDRIYSEYGMTELLSQAYTNGSEWFTPPLLMKALPRDPYDPLLTLPLGNAGGINIIDLANIHSCAFIATGDAGQVREDGKFTVLGRLDNTDIRGCNLMVDH